MKSPHQTRPVAAVLPALFRARDLPHFGIPASRLRSMLQKGEVERIARGLYRLQAAEPTELETVAAVAARSPQAIVCLLTALHIHGIGTQLPREVWIALDRKARKPQPGDLPVRLMRFSGPMLRYGIESREVQGVLVRITSPARTIVDCFRYRAKIGMDVALEALRDGLRTRKVTMDELVRAAEVCRISTVMKPYLETIAP